MLENDITSVPRAYVVGLRTDQTEKQFQNSVDECAALAEAAGYEVVWIFTQNLPSVHKATYVGEGKIEEIRDTLENVPADAVIFDDTLTPMQIRNIGKILGTVVLDRTGLILDIFSDRAQTREAKLQVESAKLQYMLPRLAGLRQNLDRQGGNSGARSSRGAGEKQIELDRRHIEHRLTILRKELAQVKKERETQRNRRLRTGEFLVALVGYTNAGKSTLMNDLLQFYGDGKSKEKTVLEKDMLFATLDTTIRRISPKGGRPFLISDTVGFISALPTALVEAFHSTLEEAVYADLLIQVVDYSDEDHAFQEEITARTLKEIGAGNIPMITVYNKMDRYRERIRTELPEGTDILSIPTFPQAREDRVYTVLKNREENRELVEKSLQELLTLIESKRSAEEELHTFRIPYAQTGDLHKLKELGLPVSEQYLEDYIELQIKIRKELCEEYREYEA
ncbi:MAG: GTPase HflX [Lachnospiraceae bacterium]|nr:GTPase HflX [Lachnospiraceae bacterium]